MPKKYVYKFVWGKKIPRRWEVDMFVRTLRSKEIVEGISSAAWVMYPETEAPIVMVHIGLPLRHLEALVTEIRKEVENVRS